jgi:hypothetical protein
LEWSYKPISQTRLRLAHAILKSPEHPISAAEYDLAKAQREGLAEGAVSHDANRRAQDVADEEKARDCVELASMDSFPCSDAPGYYSIRL